MAADGPDQPVTVDYLEVYPGGGINIYLKLTGEGGV